VGIVVAVAAFIWSHKSVSALMVQHGVRLSQKHASCLAADLYTSYSIRLTVVGSCLAGIAHLAEVQVGHTEELVAAILPVGAVVHHRTRRTLPADSSVLDSRSSEKDVMLTAGLDWYVQSGR
jgi:hypothetical protein